MFLGSGRSRLYKPSHHFRQLYDKLEFKYSFSRTLSDDTFIWPMELELGAFEIYFMGVKLFSKLKSGVWPNTLLVASKCKMAYDSYVNEEQIDHYETLTMKSTFGGNLNLQFKSGSTRVN